MVPGYSCLKTLEIYRFSDVSGGIKNNHWTEMGEITHDVFTIFIETHLQWLVFANV